MRSGPPRGRKGSPPAGALPRWAFSARTLCFAKDPWGRYRYVSPEWQRLMGLSEEDALGKTDEELVAQRGRGLEELERSEARYRQLVEHSPEAVLVIDVESGRFVDANENALELFGAPESVLLSLSPAHVSPSVQADGKSSKLQAKLYLERASAGERVVFDWMCQSLSGELIASRVWLAKDPAAPSRVRASVLDMREIDRTKTDLARVQSELDQSRRLEGLGRLASGVSHDFNNLLTIMVSSLDFLEEIENAPEALQEELITLREATERARGLTSQLLAFARKPSGTPRSVEVDAAVSSATRTLARLVGEDAALEVNLGAPGARVWIDPSQLDQILLNLVVNAREAIDLGGRLSVTTKSSLTAEGPMLTLVVADDGIGMSPDVLEKAFEPFFSTKGGAPSRGAPSSPPRSATTRVQRGSGLGLSTVYGIVRGAGGTIFIDSHPGEGTQVHVELPLHSGRTTTRPPPLPRGSEGRGAERRILLVEDEDAVRRVTARILRRAGFVVMSAALPSEALELIEHSGNRIDGILSDVVMPEMSGFALVDRIHERLPHLPVLFVSGYPSDALAERGIDPDEIDLLAKPFEPEELVRRLLERLEAHGSHQHGSHQHGSHQHGSHQHGSHPSHQQGPGRDEGSLG